MGRFSRNVGSFDWVLIVLYLALVSIGWINIYSAAFDPTTDVFASMDNLYFKQLIWILLGFGIITFILFLDSKFFVRFSSVIYIVSLLSLLLLFVLRVLIFYLDYSSLARTWEFPQSVNTKKEKQRHIVNKD